MIPKNRLTLPQEITKGLFSPEYIARKQGLNDLLQEVVVPERKAEAKDRMIQRAARPLEAPLKSDRSGSPQGVVPIPVTAEEAEEADRQIAQTLQRIQAVRNKMDLVRTRVDQAISDELSGKELSFTVDIEGKRAVERAIKSLYGEPLEVITYSMYKDMLAAKAQMERDEVKDFSVGKIKDED